MHARAIAHLQTALREERIVRRRERLREAARLRPRDRVGNRHGMAFVHDRELGLTAAPDDGHHPVALREPEDPLAGGDDLAGELEPWYVLRAAGGAG